MSIDTKEYIIDKSYHLFLSRSYEAVSISDISKEIGLTKGALYHHFLNKEELFKAVVDKYLILDSFDKLENEITLLDFIDKIVSHAKETFGKIYNSTSAYVSVNHVSLFIDAFRHYSDFADKRKSFLRNEIEKIKTILERAVQNGEIRSDIDVSVMATNFYSIGAGLLINSLVQNCTDTALNMLENQLKELYKIIKV